MSIWKSLGFRASPYDVSPLKPTAEGAELLVGRSEETIELCTVLEAHSNGVFIISGQPGVGKTSFFNVTQFSLENSQAHCGPHLMCARTLCPIQPTDEPLDVAQRALASLVKSVEEYCALSTRPVPPQTRKISKWINDRGGGSFDLGITILSFGVTFGRSIDLPRYSDTSFERLLDVLTCVISEIVVGLKFEGAFIVLDNIENLDEEKTANLMMTFRDTLFVTPHLWWIIIGQSGLSSLLQAREPRVFERVSGVGLELKPIGIKELHEAIEKRVTLFHAAGDGKAPLSEQVHDHLYQASHGEIRFVFKYGSDICTKVMSGIRIDVMKSGKKIPESTVDEALGRLLVAHQIPNAPAERVLKHIVKEELSGLDLKRKDRELLLQIGEKKVARASMHKEFGLKTMQELSSTLARLHRLHLLVRRQEGRSVTYRPPLCVNISETPAPL